MPRYFPEHVPRDYEGKFTHRVLIHGGFRFGFLRVQDKEVQEAYIYFCPSCSAAEPDVRVWMDGEIECQLCLASWRVDIDPID